MLMDTIAISTIKIEIRMKLTRREPTHTHLNEPHFLWLSVEAVSIYVMELSRCRSIWGRCLSVL